ncbi:alpha/beta hydrolase-fold protein [Pirellulaceae bacterium SH449]
MIKLLTGIWVACILLIANQPMRGCSNDARDDSELVRVAFRARMATPETLQESELPDLFVAGNLESLGRWRPNGLRLSRSEDGSYRGDIEVPAGTNIEFKMTCGSWDRVEKDESGRDIGNRRITVSLPGDGQELIVDVVVAQFARAASESTKSSVTGTLITHDAFPSNRLSNSRPIYVWLPLDYDSSEDTYPVLYMHDGQNLFDSAKAAFGVEWNVDETAQKLIQSKTIAPFIIVGIGNTKDRIDEYTLTQDRKLNRGGRGKEMIAFITEELKPFVDKTYRTRPQREATWIGGSSLGGLISLYACMERPDVFGGCFAFSPSLGWDEERLLIELQSESQWPKEVWLWFSMGTMEGRDQDTQSNNVSRARRLAALLSLENESNKDKGQYREFEGGKHTEADWAAQFADAMKDRLAVKQSD